MQCPLCSGDTKVLYSIFETNEVYRRRKCLKCEHIFYTKEQYSNDARYKFNKAVLSRRKASLKNKK